MKVRKNRIIALSVLCIGLLAACGQRKQKEQTEELCGSDRDAHGCIGTAGYTWSEVQQNCIRLFESGTRLEATDGNDPAFIVFSPDSAKVELFFSDGRPAEILDRRPLPGGGFAWNVEDDDTKNVRQSDGLWTISQRGKEIYRQEQEENN